MKLTFFTFLVCALHKERKQLSDFDPISLKNYFELSNVFKKSGISVKNLQNKVNFTKKSVLPPIALILVIWIFQKSNKNEHLVHTVNRRAELIKKYKKQCVCKWKT